MPDTQQLWSKDLPLDQMIHRFTVGDDPQLDLQLLPYDLLGTAAHVRMLAATGLLPAKDLAPVLAELAHVARDGLTIHVEQEDCHTAIEHALTAALGDTGRRVHLGRSRNDQVALALRLYLMDRLLLLGHTTARLAHAFLAFAGEHAATPLPGYTHLRRAMPSSFGLWTVAFAEALIEQLEALQAVHRRLDRCPLGSGAGFGVPLPVDREHVARLLGFSRVQRSVTDVQNSRGRMELAVAGWISDTGNVLEKYLWDLALYSTAEFGFVSLPDEFTTGSSIMPQKRNPDVVELARGRCTVLRGLRTQLECTTCGLPGNYHRDYQLQKPPLLQAVSQAAGLLDVLARLVPAVRVNAESALQACDNDIYATQEACRRVVEDGLPFRRAYSAVGHEVLNGTAEYSREAAFGQHTGGLGRLELEAAAGELDGLEHWIAATNEHQYDAWQKVLPGLFGGNPL